MYKLVFVIICVSVTNQEARYRPYEEMQMIDVIDLSRPTTLKVMSEYYNAVKKNWKICINCGIPGLGTAMHLEHSPSSNSMLPAVIPTEFLLTRLAIIDISSLVAIDPTMTLTLDVALQWMVLKHDPREPTLLLFKFGWDEEQGQRMRSCSCKIPGISYDLAEWITNLTHIVGVATDCPSLESAQTREMTLRTVSNLLGRSGIYMIENVNLKRKLPERGCMAIAMPLKLLNTNYVPTRLTAFCPAQKTDKNVVLALKNIMDAPKMIPSRTYEVNLEEIMS